jgi:hypothetical protein
MNFGDKKFKSLCLEYGAAYKTIYVYYISQHWTPTEGVLLYGSTTFIKYFYKEILLLSHCDG